MPNNRDDWGSFAQSFGGSDPQPVTALFGAPGSEWGGPVTVARGDSSNTTVNQPDAVAARPGIFVGPQLFYAWGVPTGVRASNIRNAAGDAVRSVSTNSEVTMTLHPHGATPGAGILRTAGLQPVGEGGSGGNVRTWILLPTLRVPMRAQSFNVSGLNSSLAVRVVPSDAGGTPPPDMERTVMALDEIHLMRAARLFRENNELVRVNLAGGGREVLARNIVGLQFEYDPDDSILTMYIAAQGLVGGAAGRSTPDWPWPDNPLVDTRRDVRVVMRTLSWRIRN
jgi:hypothetical protein